MTEMDNNLVSLRELMEEKFKANDKELELFREVLEHRLTVLNNAREEMRAYIGSTVSRQEITPLIERINDDIRSLRESRAGVEGKASQLSVNITFLFALSSFVLGIVSLFLK